mgnify:FL=1
MHLFIENSFTFLYRLILCKNKLVDKHDPNHIRRDWHDIVTIRGEEKWWKWCFVFYLTKSRRAHVHENTGISITPHPFDRIYISLVGRGTCRAKREITKENKGRKRYIRYDIRE